MILPAFLSAKLPATLYVAAALHACPTALSPEIIINTELNPPSYDQTMTRAQLTKTAGKNAALLKQGWSFPGRTEGHFDLQHQVLYAYEGQIEPAGTVCIRIVKIKYDIIYTAKVRIASDYKKGTCRYKTTLAHEQKHVAIDKGLLNEYAKTIKSALEQYAQEPITTIPVPEQTFDHLTARASAQLKSTTEKLADALNKERNKRQATLDTIENYTREQKQCP